MKVSICMPKKEIIQKTICMSHNRSQTEPVQLSKNLTTSVHCDVAPLYPFSTAAEAFSVSSAPIQPASDTAEVNPDTARGLADSINPKTDVAGPTKHEARQRERYRRFMTARVMFSSGLSLFLMSVIVLAMVSTAITAVLIGWVWNVTWIPGLLLMALGVVSGGLDIYDVIVGARKRRYPRVIHMVDVLFGVVSLVTGPFLLMISIMAYKIKQTYKA